MVKPIEREVFVSSSAEEMPDLNDSPLWFNSPFWEHLSFPVRYINGQRQIDKPKAVCWHCSVEIYSFGSASNVLVHLKQHHTNVNYSAA